MSIEKCTCAGKRKLSERTIDYVFECKELGDVLLDALEVRGCDCGEQVWFNPAQGDELHRRVDREVQKFIGYLPLDSFVSRKEALEILGTTIEEKYKSRFKKGRMIYQRKFGKETVYHRGSVELFARTGDGRFNLIAELAKNSTYHAMVAKTNIRRGAQAW